MQQFWRDVPVLSWVADAESGRLHFNGTQGDSGPADPEAWRSRLVPHINGSGHGPFQILESLPGPDGRLHHFLVIGFPVHEPHGAARPRLAGVVVDVTHHKRRMDELAQQALVDELTGLYNLRGFFLLAEHELKVARRRGTRSAVVYVDVDGLKGVNDAHGHEEGNVLLVETAALLRRTFRECDVIARLGGDEFAVFAADVRESPEALGQRLNRELLETGVASRATLSVSCGVADGGGDASLTLAHLLATADNAMYRDKLEKIEARHGSRARLDAS